MATDVRPAQRQEGDKLRTNAVRSVVDLLGSVPLMQQLPTTFFLKIVDVGQLMHIGQGELVVREGEFGEGLYIILKGKVEVSRSVDGAKQQHTSLILTQGECFGHASVETWKQLHKADIVALSEVTCFVLLHKHASLLTFGSKWPQQPSLVERLLHLNSVETMTVASWQKDLFKASPITEAPAFNGKVYGGQLVGQALVAATKTVDKSLLVHSLHSYFIRGGDPSCPILYKVERTRDGETFATRHVQALQKGKIVFTMYASFQRGWKGLEHQYPMMPSTPTPEELQIYEDLLTNYCTDPLLSKKMQRGAMQSVAMGRALDLRYAEPRPFAMQNLEPRQRVWMRVNGILSDDQALQRCAAAYAYDWSFLETAMRPHVETIYTNDFLGASLDLSMWFHKPFRADDWVLLVMESPQASDSRGLCFARAYTPSGELVASVCQEGMLRIFNLNAKL